MKNVVKLLAKMRRSRSLWRFLAAIALVLGVPMGALAQVVVYKNSGALTGSLANTLQGDLQVANGRTLTISTNGSLIIGPGSTVDVGGATFTGAFTLSNVTILGGTATLSSLTVSGTASLSTATVSTLTVASAIIVGGNATLSTATITTETVSTASISTISVSTATNAGTFRAISATGGIGYGSGSGGAVVQTTSKTNAVTLNNVTGQITLSSYSMSSGARASFVVTNSAVVPTDTIITNVNSASYSAHAFAGTGTALFTIYNQAGVTVSDSPTINFAIIRGSSN